MQESDKLMRARCKLLTKEPWYGAFSMNISWIPSDMPWLEEGAKTMGVRIMSTGDIQCIYYPPFVESMRVEEVLAVIQHEIEHIVRLHCLRVNSRNPQVWNIAADACVNGTRSNPRIGIKDDTNNIVLPNKGDIVWIPTHWPDNETSEHYYDLLMKNHKQMACPKCGNSKFEKLDGDKEKGKGKGKKDKGEGQGEGQSQGQGKCSECGCSGNSKYGDIEGKSFDDHSIWNQSDIGEDEARQIVKDIVNEATQKSQGKVPGHLEEAIKKLGKPIVKWRELLRHYIGRHVGNRRVTFSRRNRRRDEFGIPGVSRHAAASVNVIIDTSGSVSTKELEQFFAEIDMIAARSVINILEWDHAFQGFNKYKRGFWKKWKVHGRGGTDMAAPVKWLIDNNLVADCQILLSDGYANWLDKSEVEFPFITVLTTPEGTTSGPEYGNTVRMKVY